MTRPTGPTGPTGPSGVVEAVCVTFAVAPDGPHDRTGIDKRPVDAVTVRDGGVDGDRVVDTLHHGGRDKAVYAYASEDAAWWSERLGRDVPPGWFGENFRLRGVDLVGAVVGECWTVGEDGLAVEVTMPRTPCLTFQRHTGEEQWVRRFAEAGRVGAYLRVLQPGTARAGDVVTVVHRPHHGVTVGRWWSEQDPADARTLLAAGTDGLDLAPALVASVERVLRRAAGPTGTVPRPAAVERPV